MITRRNSLWLIPFLVILSFPVWKKPVGSYLAPRGRYDSEFLKKSVNEHNFSMINVNVLQSENGQKTADIRAAKAVTSKLPNEFILKKVDADIIDENGKITNITAHSGLYNTATRRLKLYRNVVVINKDDNFTLKTNLLYYYDIERKVHCPKKTQFEGDGVLIKGSSFDYDTGQGFYSFGGRATTTIEGYNAL